jgi:exonuclease SbcD
MTKILACGDLHLGAGADYGREPGIRLTDQDIVLTQIARLAVDEDVDAVLIAGDVFDRPRPDPATLSVFDRFLDQLAEFDVLAITGNAGHDIRNAESYAALELFSRWIDVHRMPAVWNGPGFAVATLPSVPVSRLVASRNGGDRGVIHRDAAEYLIQVVRDLRAEIPAGTPAILLLHWSISGASLPNGLPTDALNEPVLSAEDLDALGFDAVVAGHIHKPQMLVAHEADGSYASAALYVGSPMPLSFGEERDEHGVWLLDNETTLGFFDARFVPISSRRFVTVDADLTTGRHDELALGETEALAAAVVTHVPFDDAIVRLRYKATAEQHRRVDQAALRKLCLDAGAHRVYAIQADVVREDRARVAGLDESIDELGALDAYLEAQGLDPAMDRRMRERTRRYLEEVRA